MAFIRAFRASDWAAAAHICRATLPPSLDSSEAATRLAPYLWAHPFLVLCPQYAFVLDDGSGQAIGYVLGCPDVHAMAAAYDGYAAVLAGTAGGGSTGLDVDAAFVAQARADVGAPPPQLDRLEAWTLPARTAAGETVNATCLRQLVFGPRWLLLESANTAAKRALVDGPGFRATMHINLLPNAQGRGWGRQLIEAFVAAVVAAGARGLHIGVSGENTKVVPFYEKCGFHVAPGGEADGCVWMVRSFE